MWNLKIKTEQKNQNRNRLIDTENKVLVDRNEAGRGMGEKGEGSK